MLARGTLILYNSGGSTILGFIVGTCSYDNCGEDNGYVIRYYWVEGMWEPNRPYTIVDMTKVKPVRWRKWPDCLATEEFPEDFFVGGRWSITPQDRCDDWTYAKCPETGNVLIVPQKSEMKGTKP